MYWCHWRWCWPYLLHLKVRVSSLKSALLILICRCKPSGSREIVAVRCKRTIHVWNDMRGNMLLQAGSVQYDVQIRLLLCWWIRPTNESDGKSLHEARRLSGYQGSTCLWRERTVHYLWLGLSSDMQRSAIPTTKTTEAVYFNMQIRLLL